MKLFKFIHFTDWCDYHEILDAHANLSGDLNVQFIHDRADKLNPLLSRLCSYQNSRIINRFFPYNKIQAINKWRAKEIIPHCDVPVDTCLIFSSLYAASIHQSFWYYLKKIGYKLVLVYVDRLKLTPRLLDVDSLRNCFDIICTYNSEEAREYGIDVHPIRMPDLSYLRTNPIQNDVFFIGSEKGRITQINQLFDTLSRQGLKCDFYVAGYNGKDKREGIKYISNIPYSESLEKASHAKAIVNLLQPGSSGLTIRDKEAYNLGTYIITNNNDECVQELYQEGQLIDMNKESFMRQLVPLSRDFKRFEKKGNYSYEEFYNWLNDKLQ